VKSAALFPAAFAFAFGWIAGWFTFGWIAGWFTFLIVAAFYA
jgi:hypothetical protein